MDMNSAAKSQNEFKCLHTQMFQLCNIILSMWDAYLSVYHMCKGIELKLRSKRMMLGPIICHVSDERSTYVNITIQDDLLSKKENKSVLLYWLLWSSWSTCWHDHRIQTSNPTIT